MSDWVLAHKNDYVLTNDGEIVIPSVFTESELIVHIEPDKFVQSPGLLKQIIFISGLGETVVQTYQLRLDKQLIDLIPLIPIESYKLAFVPNANFRKLRLSIWKSAMPLSRSGATLTVPHATTAVTAVIAASTNTVTLCAVNPNRKGATICNNSTAKLYLKMTTITGSNPDNPPPLGANAAVLTLETGDYYELPYGYTGLIEGVWSAANGSAFITEFT